MKVFSISDKLGANLGSRKLAAQFREELLRLKEPVVLDFAGVQVMSHSFADELFGKIAESYGLEFLRSQILIKNISKEDGQILRAVVQDRTQPKAS